MPIAAVTDFANPDPSIPFTTVGALVNLLRTLVSTVLPADLKPYVTGSATPAVNDQDKAWLRTTANGKPLGTWLFYNGAWRKQYTGLAAEIKTFFGDPAGAFDGTGKGIIGGEWDGWQIMNGQNGTANLSNQFIIGGQMDNVGITGYSGGWRTNILGTPLVQGGVPYITTTADTTYRPATTAIQAGHFSASGNTPDSSGGLYGSPANPASAPFDLIPADAGKPTPNPIYTVPPFYAFCFCQFVGYADPVP